MRKLLALILTLCLLFSHFTLAENDEPSSWSENAISELKEYNHFEEDTFDNFKENITRAEFICVAVRLYELFDNKEITPDPSISFTDTTDIYALKGATVGITSGIGDNKFGPNDSLTREQLATFMIRILKLGDVEMNASTDYKFSDENSFNAWSKEAIYSAKANGIIGGIGNDIFDSKGMASTEMALVIANRIISNNQGKEWTNATTNTAHNINVVSSKNDKTITFDGYTKIEVDGGSLSGYRQANVVVDIGFGDRDYYAFTNEYGQLIKVTAKEIVLQNEETEPVLSTGRYYHDEAKVPGTESAKLDEGHVIADSLGGVANAYNITPQDSILNRHGDQAYLEKVIREAGGCTEFEVIITYPNNTTQVPSNYGFTYTINGNVINDEFDNVNPDVVNSNLEIVSVDLSSEKVVIKNNSNEAINLHGHVLVSVVGNQRYTFPSYNLASGSTVSVYSGRGSGDLKWTGGYIWNNDGDSAELLDSNGDLLDTYN